MRLPSIAPTAWPSTPLDARRYASVLAPPLLGSAAFPALADAVRPVPGAEPPAFALVLAFLVGRRVLLYSWAVCTVELAALRSVDASPSLGQRLERVTKEGAAPLTVDLGEGSEARAVVQALDETTPAQQAAALPVLLGATLLAAFVLTVGPQALAPAGGGGAEDQLALEQAAAAAKEAAAVVAPLSNAATCLFFVNAEARALAAALRSAGDEGEAPPPWLELLPSLLAAAAVGGAFALPATAGGWPLQNGVNVAVAVGVARVIQLPQLGAVAAALIGLALYDALFTGGAAMAAATAAAADGAAGAAALTSGGGGGGGGGGSGASVMESVARARLSGDAGWQPGLMVVCARGRITDALGLGDLVFPAMLAGWAGRFDARTAAAARDGDGGDGNGDDGAAADDGRTGGGGGGGHLRACLVGYLVGCVGLEVAPPELTSAALPFLVPPMLVALGGTLLRSGGLGEALRAAPDTSSDGGEQPPPSSS